jgi:N-acyl-L-homoserine lactone synthetase
MSAVQPQIMFRPARSEAELEELLRLRYDVYSAHHIMSRFLTPNELGIDMDAYDVNAHHLGLFRENSPIGCARLIALACGPQAEWIQSIGRRHGGLLAWPFESPEAPLPAMSYAKEIEPALGALLGRGNHVAEASRLSLVADQRSRGLANFFAHAIISYWLLNGFDTAVVFCRLSHTRMWKSVGFRLAPGTRELAYKGVPCNVLVVRRDWIPLEAREIAYRLADQFQLHGHLLAA